MRIRLHGQVIDANTTPLLLELSAEERRLIAAMPDGACVLPYGDPEATEALEEWPWPPARDDYPDWADFPQQLIGFRKRRFVMTGLTSNDRMIGYWRRQRKFYEQPLLRRCMQRVKGTPGAIVDVGANLGNHTVFFGNYCGVRRLIAIEAQPLTFSVLEFNCQHNIKGRNFKAHNVAASDYDGEIGIEPIKPRNVGGTHVCEAGAESCERIIPCCKLDTLLSNVHAALIKIDVEEHEPAVLRGALKLLETCKPLLVLEAHTQDDMDAIAEVIGPLGYKQEPRRYGKNNFWSIR